MIEWNKTKKNIIIDFDGVILDSRQRHSEVLSDSINKINGLKTISDDYKDFVSYKSNGYPGINYLIEKKIPNDEKIIAEWIKRIEQKKYLQFDVLYPGTKQSLEKLKNKYNLLLVTVRSNHKNAYWQLSHLNILNYFCKIILVNNKGNPGLDKYNALCSLPIFAVIGDTEVDLALSEYAQCFFFPMNNGFRSLSYWNKFKKKSYQNLMEVTNIIYKIQ